MTRDVTPRLESLSAATPNVRKTYVCSATDHHSSTYGDRGWGCGFRNFQMLLSSLAQDGGPIAQRLSIVGIRRGQMPSISRLQSLIEDSWKKGFDAQGAEQLGGKLRNTRKWIGATEIVACLAALGIKSDLVDFHKPTGADGSHPALFNWVADYFRTRSGRYTPPLYFQHEGHSRTIAGIEILKNSNGLRLLVLDPSHSKMADLTSANAVNVMKGIRKLPSGIKSRQYQIVAVTGVFKNDEEMSRSKRIKSTRIP